MQTEHLIDSLTAKLRPVRRYRSPWMRAVLFLVFALVLGLMVEVLHEKVVEPSAAQAIMARPTLAGALMTGVLAAISAFVLGQPDRSRLWALLPIPALAIWLSSMGYQCLTNWVEIGPEGMSYGETTRCFATLFMMAVPLGLAAVLMLRNMASFDPARIIGSAALAVAGLTAAAMDVFHPADASALVILFNLGTVILILTSGWLVRRLEVSGF